MDEELKKLLEDNLAKNEEIYQISQKLKSYLLLAQIMSIVRILIIVVPIILAILYLPPFLESIFGQYREILNIGGKNLPL